MFVILILILAVVLTIAVILIVRASMISSRKRKFERCTGTVRGKVVGIKDRGPSYPWVIQVVYTVDGKDYEVSETAKMKTKAIKVAGIPIGMEKTFMLGDVREGDWIEIRYDPEHPEKAIIPGNEGLITD